MDEIALHIDFLLHTHDCIIVPGLGGFVVNMTEVERDGIWGLNAPTFELIFNSKLTYNDGLLAESLMKTNNETYAIAIKKIESASEELKSKMMLEEEVVWTNLGSFKINKENNLIFLPNKAYIRPQYFGLSNCSVKPAVLKLSQTSNNDNLIPVKSFFQYVFTAVAVAFLFFFVVVSYNNNIPKTQHAEIVSKPLIFSMNHSRTTRPKVIKPKVAIESPRVIASETTNTDVPLPTAVETKKRVIQSTQSTSSGNFYIVVGVYKAREIAEETLSSLKSQGFQSASLIERPKRLDVYAATFTSRKEAYTYLKKFKADNPSYQDAWVLKH